MKRKKLTSTLLFAIGLIVFIVIFYFIGIGKIINQIKQLNVFYYIIFLVCFFAAIVFWSLRWKSFLDVGYNVSLFEILKINMVGFSVSNLTPIAKVGGEPVRCYLLGKRNNVPMDFGMATIFSDLSMEFLVSFIWVIISVALLFFLMSPPIWLSSILIVFLLMSFFCLGSLFGIYSGKSFINKMIIWFTGRTRRLRSLRERVLNKYGSFRESFISGLKNRKAFSKALFFASLVRIFNMLKFFFIFMALNYNITILEAVVIAGVAIMFMTIPATPGNLGILEGGMVSVFILMGIPADIAASAVFLERIVSFWFVTMFGSLIGLKFGIDLKKMPTKGLK